MVDSLALANPNFFDRACRLMARPLAALRVPREQLQRLERLEQELSGVTAERDALYAECQELLEGVREAQTEHEATESYCLGLLERATDQLKTLEQERDEARAQVSRLEAAVFEERRRNDELKAHLCRLERRDIAWQDVIKQFDMMRRALEGVFAVVPDKSANKNGSKSVASRGRGFGGRLVAVGRFGDPGTTPQFEDVVKSVPFMVPDDTSVQLETLKTLMHELARKHQEAISDVSQHLEKLRSQPEVPTGALCTSSAADCELTVGISQAAPLSDPTPAPARPPSRMHATLEDLLRKVNRLEILLERAPVGDEGDGDLRGPRRRRRPPNKERRAVLQKLLDDNLAFQKAIE